MDQQNIIEDILVILEANGVKIRTEPLEESGGGLCSIRGERVLFLDSRASPSQQTDVSVQALLDLVDIDTIYLRPEVRRFIESQQHT